MVTKVFHDDNDNQMKIIVNTKDEMVICVGDVFGQMELNYIIIDIDEIDLLIKEIRNVAKQYKEIHGL